MDDAKSQQEVRRKKLIQDLIQEDPRYTDIEIPQDELQQRTLLRGLFNTRMPAPISRDFLEIQDLYLREETKARGVVYPEDIPTVEDAYGVKDDYSNLLSMWQGDITRLSVDAIVNAANSQMLGCFIPSHNCIDNCIHTFAGIQLRSECNDRMEELRQRKGTDYLQPTAVPMLTDAYNLPSKKVIHIVGPIVDGELTKEHEEDLKNCYIRSLDMCKDNGLKTIAFCSISTGVFRFPKTRAAEIAVQSCKAWLGDNPKAMERVIFNVFSHEDRVLYESILGAGSSV